MANPAFPQPGMPGPQAVESTKNGAVAETRATPLQHASTGEVPDLVFKWVITACGVAVLAVLVLIVYELVEGSQLSWHAFGLKFFGASDWDPVSELFGALPFIYGTVVSSVVALIIAV